MAKLTLETREAMTADDMADEAGRIAAMIRDGFTSGETVGSGWWSVEDLAPDNDLEEAERPYPDIFGSDRDNRAAFGPRWPNL